MGVTERRAREKEELRQGILAAATEMFANEGYESVSIRKIADRIEYAPSTIYLYFKDKAELIGTICEENFRLLNKALDALIGQGLPPLEMLRSCLRAYIQFGLEHPNHYIVTFCLPDAKTHELTPEEAARVLNEGLCTFARLSRGLSECMDAGVISRANVELTAQSTWMMLHGVTSLLVTKSAFPFIDKAILIEACLERILLGLGAKISLTHPAELPL